MKGYEPDCCADCGNQFPPGQVCDRCRPTWRLLVLVTFVAFFAGFVGAMIGTSLFI